jgi:hypothetical protein
MALTTAQLATLKTDIEADPAFASIPHTPDGAWVIADAYKVVPTPEFTVWRTSVEKKEVVQQTSREGTTFVWAGNGFIGRSAGELECWNQLFNSSLTCNPALPNVRQAFTDIFSGTGNAATNRTHLQAVSKRAANRLEKLFATGTGSLASPATMTVEGSISYDEVMRAMGW